MLVFRTVCPLKSEATLQKLIDISIKWIDGSPHYELSNQLSSYYGNDNFKKQTQSEKIECFTYEIDDSIYACIFFEKRESDKKWITEIVYKKYNNSIIFSIHIYCETSNFENTLNDISKPYLIKILDREIGFGNDGIFPTTHEPYYFSSDEVNFACDIINGNFQSYLPCIYVSINEAGEYSLEIDKISRLLSGVAHIFIEPNIYFSQDLRRKTQGNNPYLGAVGIFFPNHGNKKIMLPSYRNNYKIEVNTLFNAVKNSLNFGIQPEELSFSKIKTDFIKNKQINANQNDKQAMLDYAISENEEQKNIISKQKEEIYQLKIRLKISEESFDKNSVSSLINKGEELDSYQGQIHDTIIELIEDYKKTHKEIYEKNTRKRNIINDILEHNPKIGQKEKIIDELKNIFSGYRVMTSSIESKLKGLGFSVDKSSPHYKLYLTSYPQISIPLPASGSDKRGGKNCVSDIKKVLL